MLEKCRKSSSGPEVFLVVRAGFAWRGNRSVSTNERSGSRTSTATRPPQAELAAIYWRHWIIQWPNSQSEAGLPRNVPCLAWFMAFTDRAARGRGISSYGLLPPCNPSRFPCWVYFHYFGCSLTLSTHTAVGHPYLIQSSYTIAPPRYTTLSICTNSRR